MDSGVGETIIRAILTGKSTISGGVGKIELDIHGYARDYSIKPSIGIGTIILNGKKCVSDETYGDGDYSIKIDGGIGEISIKTK